MPSAAVASVSEPIGQSSHEACVETAEYLPAAQSTQVVAPAPVPASVIDPAAHVWHAESVEAVDEASEK